MRWTYICEWQAKIYKLFPINTGPTWATFFHCYIIKTVYSHTFDHSFIPANVLSIDLLPRALIHCKKHELTIYQVLIFQVSEHISWKIAQQGTLLMTEKKCLTLQGNGFILINEHGFLVEFQNIEICKSEKFLRISFSFQMSIDIQYSQCLSHNYGLSTNKKWCWTKKTRWMKRVFLYF